MRARTAKNACTLVCEGAPNDGNPRPWSYYACVCVAHL